MFAISITFRENGGFLVVEVPEEKINNQYVLSPDKAISIYEAIANIVDLAQPIITLPDLPMKKKRRKK